MISYQQNCKFAMFIRNPHNCRDSASIAYRIVVEPKMINSFSNFHIPLSEFVSNPHTNRLLFWDQETSKGGRTFYLATTKHSQICQRGSNRISHHMQLQAHCGLHRRLLYCFLLYFHKTEVCWHLIYNCKAWKLCQLSL